MQKFQVRITDEIINHQNIQDISFTGDTSEEHKKRFLGNIAKLKGHTVSFNIVEGENEVSDINKAKELIGLSQDVKETQSVTFTYISVIQREGQEMFDTEFLESWFLELVLRRSKCEIEEIGVTLMPMQYSSSPLPSPPSPPSPSSPSPSPPSPSSPSPSPPSPSPPSPPSPSPQAREQAFSKTQKGILGGGIVLALAVAALGATFLAKGKELFPNLSPTAAMAIGISFLGIGALAIIGCVAAFGINKHKVSEILEGADIIASNLDETSPSRK